VCLGFNFIVVLCVPKLIFIAAYLSSATNRVCGLHSTLLLESTAPSMLYLYVFSC